MCFARAATPIVVKGHVWGSRSLCGSGSGRNNSASAASASNNPSTMLWICPFMLKAYYSGTSTLGLGIS